MKLNFPTIALIAGIGATAIAATQLKVVEEATEAPKAAVTEQVAPAPAPAPVPAPAPKAYEFKTSEAAQTEVCDAALQYSRDIARGLMTVEQGKQELRSYVAYVSQNSPDSAPTLARAGFGCFKF